MCYPDCGMLYIKEPLLVAAGFLSLSLSEWFFTISLMPYNLSYYTHPHIYVFRNKQLYVAYALLNL